MPDEVGLSPLDRCVACDWFLQGTFSDPRVPPVPMGCMGMGSVKYPQCAGNWLAADPEDRGSYDEFVASESRGSK